MPEDTPLHAHHSVCYRMYLNTTVSTRPTTKNKPDPRSQQISQGYWQPHSKLPPQPALPAELPYCLCPAK